MLTLNKYMLTGIMQYKAIVIYKRCTNGASKLYVHLERVQRSWNFTKIFQKLNQTFQSTL